jgi:hypothetical protein
LLNLGTFDHQLMTSDGTWAYRSSRVGASCRASRKLDTVLGQIFAGPLEGDQAESGFRNTVPRAGTRSHIPVAPYARNISAEWDVAHLLRAARRLMTKR